MTKKEEKDYYSKPLADESPEWFQRFEIYRSIDSRYRSVLASYKQYSKLKKITVSKLGTEAPKSWVEASRKFQWDSRARAHDVACLAVQQQELLAQKTEKAKTWARRAQKKKENDWEDAQALRAKAMQLLERPIQWVTVRIRDIESGQFCIVSKPFGWSTKDALIMLKVASELSQSALSSELELVQAINVMVENDMLPADALMFLEKNTTEFHTAIRSFFNKNYSADWQQKVALLENAANN
jgi:hypothetical protein